MTAEWLLAECDRVEASCLAHRSLRAPELWLTINGAVRGRRGTKIEIEGATGRIIDRVGKTVIIAVKTAEIRRSLASRLTTAEMSPEQFEAFATVGGKAAKGNDGATVIARRPTL